MIVKAMAGLEQLVAKVTLPSKAVEGTVRSSVSGVLFRVPSDLLVGDGAVRIPLTHHTVDCFPVELRSAWTGATLKVVDQAAGGGVLSDTERACDAATMGL